MNLGIVDLLEMGWVFESSKESWLGPEWVFESSKESLSGPGVGTLVE